VSEPAILCPFTPKSWFHPRGIRKVLADIEPRLPDVRGSLFLTFTIDPSLEPDPLEAFKHSRDKLRRVFHKLRKGVPWGDKRFCIDAPYCIKVEFHQSGWVHYHCIFLTRRFLPGELLNELWGLGRTNVQRVKSDNDFRYLLKYVTKGGSLPDWALELKRIRIFQPSRGFYRQPESTPCPDEPVEAEPPQDTEPVGVQKRASYTLGERLERWRKQATYIQGDKVRAVNLCEPFQDLLGLYVLAVARAGNYLGNGRIQINKEKEIIPWLTKQQTNHNLNAPVASM